MSILGTRLKKRAQELGISNAEAARRIGLEERRYGHYVRGLREPDLAMLVRIATILETTPNALLGVDDRKPDRSRRSRLKDRLAAAANAMSDDELTITVVQAEALASHVGSASGR